MINNAATTVRFLALVDSATKTAILGNIAKHYGISSEEAYAEIVDPDAENLLEYITGPERAAASLLMKRHGLYTQ